MEAVGDELLLEQYRKRASRSPGIPSTPRHSPKLQAINLVPQDLRWPSPRRPGLASLKALPEEFCQKSVAP